VLGEVVAQLVEAPFPTRTPLGDPLLDGAERLGFDAAGAYPSDLLGPDKSACFQDLQVLDHRWQ
jgi:hypothetical protein